jgi:hypothetical protein
MKQIFVKEEPREEKKEKTHTSRTGICLLNGSNSPAIRFISWDLSSDFEPNNLTGDRLLNRAFSRKEFILKFENFKIECIPQKSTETQLRG